MIFHLHSASGWLEHLSNAEREVQRVSQTLSSDPDKTLGTLAVYLGPFQPECYLFCLFSSPSLATSSLAARSHSPVPESNLIVHLDSHCLHPKSLRGFSTVLHNTPSPRNTAGTPHRTLLRAREECQSGMWFLF